MVDFKISKASLISPDCLATFMAIKWITFSWNMTEKFTEANLSFFRAFALLQYLAYRILSICSTS